MQINIGAFVAEANFSYDDLLLIEADAIASEGAVYDTEQWQLKEFQYNLPEKEKYSFLVKVNGKPVGFSIGYAFRPRWLHISRVAVMKGYRGRRLGHLMLSRQLETMKLDSPEMISVDVNEKNKRAISLYQALGFKMLEGVELEEYVHIRGRVLEEYIGESPSHIVMVIKEV
jgi:ribosomal protein S18 acetylase RimI-like enzyme